ncbi:MAG: DUF481 domain-containing protein [Candidatus Methylomirabilis sp.]|nr:DUF481 domain-containing protein [Deltaproteobacteria bacterium]
MFRSFNASARRACALALALTFTAAPAARAEDRVTVKGDVLRGTVHGIEGGKLRLETVYGGQLAIPLEDVEVLEAEGTFYVFYGEEGEIPDRIAGVEGGKLLVGPPDRLRRVPFGDIYAAVPVDDVNGSALSLWKYRMRYWSASFDLGAAYTEATTDSFAFNQAFKVERKTDLTRALLGQSYRYGTEKEEDEDKSVTLNELKGNARFEYNLTERLFVFANGEGEHNAIQRLSYRAIPSGGLGYKLVKTEDTTFQVEAGGAGVFERFYGGDREDSASVIFGAELNSLLPFGAKLFARVDYLPSVDDWKDDYLIRSKASLEYPLLEYVSVKLGVTDDYDNTPAEDTQRNQFTTTAALSLVW